MNEWKRAIVRVWHGRPHKGGRYRGTAFMVAPGTFVTAKHVVTDIPSDEMYLRGPAWDDDASYAILNPISHESLDVVILRLKKITTTVNPIHLSAPSSKEFDLKPGQKVLIAGYGTTDSSLETITLEITSYESLFDLEVVHTHIARGMSGGPVLLNDKLVGVIRARHRDQNKSYFLRLDSFRDFIDQHLTKAYRSKGMLVGVPELPPNFLPRQDVLDSLKNKLILHKTGPITVTSAEKIGLHGMGGIGKTVLAIALCHDTEIQQKYYDGIYWITLGEDPDIISCQVQLAEFVSKEREHFSDIQSGKARIGELLTDVACLIVLDDVWEIQHISAFNISTPQTQLLITTRNSNLLTGIASEKIDLELLTLQQALKLLAAWSNQPKLPPPAYDIVKECGRLPLAIAMVGAMLRDRVANEDWEDVLELLREADITEIEQEFPDYKHKTLFSAIHASIDQLDTGLLDRYFDLAVFPDDTPIPTSVLQTFWSDGQTKRSNINRLLHKMEDLSLLQQSETGVITIHDLQRDYIRCQTGADLPKLHQRLLSAYCKSFVIKETIDAGELCQWTQGPDDGYYFEHLCYHLHEAGSTDELEHLLTNLFWLQTKLRVCGFNSLIHDFIYAQKSSYINAIKHALQLSATVLKKDPSQLQEQLGGRLLLHPSRHVQNFIHNLKGKSCWLRPIRTGLTPANGALLKTFSDKSVKKILMELTPDGTKILSTSWGETVKVDVWDFTSFRKLFSLTGHYDDINSIAITADGKRAVTASALMDKTLRVWDLSNGKLLHVLSGHAASVDFVLLSSNGHLAVSASEDQKIKIWDLAVGKEIYTLMGHTREINAVAITPDDSKVISASNDKTLKVWDIITGKEIYTLSGHHAGIEAVAVSHCGSFAVSASRDRTLKIWDLKSGTTRHTLCCHSAPVFRVCISLDSILIISASSDGMLKVWDMSTGKEVHSLFGHAAAVHSITVTHDNTRLISASADKTLIVWELSTGKKLLTFYGHTDVIFSVAVTRDGSQAISASKDGSVKVWNMNLKEDIKALPVHSGSVTSVAVSYDNARLISGSDDGTLKVWKIETGKELHTLCGKSASRIDDIITLPNCNYVISVGGVYRAWDISTGREIQIKQEDFCDLNRYVALKYRTYIVSKSYIGNIKVWEIDNGKEIFRLDNGCSSGINGVTTLDGKQLISCSERNIIVRLLSTGRIIKTIPIEWAPHTFVYTADGKEAVRTSWTMKDVHDSSESIKPSFVQESDFDNMRSVIREILQYEVRTWDLDTGEPKKVFNGEEIYITQYYDVRNAVSVLNLSINNFFEVISLDGTKLVIRPPGKTQLWDLTKNERRPGTFEFFDETFAYGELPYYSYRYVLALEGCFFVLGYWEGVLKLWVPINDTDIFCYWHERPDAYSHAIITPNRKRAIVSIPGSELKVFSLTSGDEICSLSINSRSVHAMACTSDGNLMVSVSTDKKITIWNLENGVEVAHFMSDEELSSCNISHDGKYIVAGDKMGELYILQLETD